MRKSDKILEELYREGEELPIPKELEPEEMEKTLKARARAKRTGRRRLYRAFAAAACALLVFGVLLKLGGTGLKQESQGEQGALTAQDGEREAKTADAEDQAAKSEEEELRLPTKTYAQLYAMMSAQWQDEAVVEDTAGSLRNGVLAQQKLMKEESMADGTEELFAAAKSADAAYGQTNVRVYGIDEADDIKNDGRYLYQTVIEDEDGKYEYRIQIVDTKDGLKEIASVGTFENRPEFFVNSDLLITVENKREESYASPVAKGKMMEDLAAADMKAPSSRGYHEIVFYDIAKRESPRKIKTFTLRGEYETSRIADGYFYGVSHFYADPGEGEEDLRAYIPSVDGELIAQDRIYCPENVSGTEYLVFVSVDLGDPTGFTDSRAVLYGDGIYYMSYENIYAASYQSVYGEKPEQDGKVSDHTEILRFSYEDGKFRARSQAGIPGRLEGSFSLDEYNGYLRAVTTVEEYQVKKVTDDRTGEELGYDYQDRSQSNGLYILDETGTIVSRIEGLAEDEEIYSARFMGNSGYFVTFRQTDPLFAVDLSDPKQPQVLGELKASGFSEYLHLWTDTLLLGIGMEADADGRQQGMKLSMFDLTDPVNLQEVSKVNLTDYDYSRALDDYRSVLIDTKQNVIGFEAEGYLNAHRKTYFVYAYEDGAFVKKLELDTKTDSGYYQSRGTFIGDVFYLLTENGSVKAYDRENGRLLEEFS